MPRALLYSGAPQCQRQLLRRGVQSSPPRSDWCRLCSLLRPAEDGQSDGGQLQAGASGGRGQLTPALGPHRGRENGPGRPLREDRPCGAQADRSARGSPAKAGGTSTLSPAQLLTCRTTCCLSCQAGACTSVLAVSLAPTSKGGGAPALGPDLGTVGAAADRALGGAQTARSSVRPWEGMAVGTAALSAPFSDEWSWGSPGLELCHLPSAWTSAAHGCRIPPLLPEDGDPPSRLGTPRGGALSRHRKGSAMLFPSPISQGLSLHPTSPSPKPSP